MPENSASTEQPAGNHWIFGWADPVPDFHGWCDFADSHYISAPRRATNKKSIRCGEAFPTTTVLCSVHSIAHGASMAARNRHASSTLKQPPASPVARPGGGNRSNSSSFLTSLRATQMTSSKSVLPAGTRSPSSRPLIKPPNLLTRLQRSWTSFSSNFPSLT